MSDLLNFFGDNEFDTSCHKNKVFKCDNNVKKSAKRPNTLNGNIQNNNNVSNQRFLFTPGSATDKRFAVSPDFVLPLLTSISCSNLMDLPHELPPENAKGNVEYKRQLLNLTPLRVQHLITQLKWRLEEGQGEAIYEIGVEDDGTVSGLESDELNESVSNLCSMANTLNASITLLRECNIGTKKALEILIRNLPNNYSAHETKVAILGNMDAGKSTLIGVLTQGMLDDGQGKTRLSTFRHIHEVRSGRTSSISCQLLGFDANNDVSNFYWLKKRLHQRNHEEVALSSVRLVSLIDLAGCWKYQHTTFFALTSRRPHFVLLVVSATNGLRGTAFHHFKVSQALRLPVAIVISKIDRCSPIMAIDQLRSWLSIQGRTIEVVTTTEGATAAAARLNSSGSIVPVIPASSVSGEGIATVTTFLGALRCAEERRSGSATEVWINDTHRSVPRAEGCVVAGHVHRGPVREHDRMWLGPQRDGRFLPVAVRSIHRNRLQHYTAHDSQTASFAVDIDVVDYDGKEENTENGFSSKWYQQSPGDCDLEPESLVQRGMVLLGQKPFECGSYLVKRCTRNVDKCSGHVAWGVVVSDINVLDDGDSLVSDLKRFPLSWIVHCGNVYQKCQVVTAACVMNHNLVQILPGRKVAFRFNNFPQFVHCDDPFVFHRPSEKMRAHGCVHLLIGEAAFDERRQDTTTSDDEYVTAPSSPV